MFLLNQAILRWRRLSHGLCIVYDVRAVEHNFRTMVLDLRMSCRNGLPCCLSPQNDRAHTKPRILCIGFYYNVFDISLLSISKKYFFAEKHNRLKVVWFLNISRHKLIDIVYIYRICRVFFFLLFSSVFWFLVCLFGWFFFALCNTIA